MRIADVVAQLEAMPATLPAPAEALVPRFSGPVGTRPPALPQRRDDARSAAVLVLLFPDETDEVRVVLTERATRDGHHSGEISFPGGRAEPGDHDLVMTALREAAEEVALDVAGAGVRVIGELEPFWIPISNYDVRPILAIAERRPRLLAAPDEVARIVEPRMDAFLPDVPLQMVERTVRGWPLRYGAYEVDGLSVWGATARILSQLGALLARSRT